MVQLCQYTACFRFIEKGMEFKANSIVFTLLMEQSSESSLMRTVFYFSIHAEGIHMYVKFCFLLDGID